MINLSVGLDCPDDGIRILLLEGRQIPDSLVLLIEVQVDCGESGELALVWETGATQLS